MVDTTVLIPVRGKRELEQHPQSARRFYMRVSLPKTFMVVVLLEISVHELMIICILTVQEHKNVLTINKLHLTH